MRDEVNVVVDEACVQDSKVSGLPCVALVLLTLEPYFLGDRVISKLYGHVPLFGGRHTGLRHAFGLDGVMGYCTAAEVRGMVGRRIRVVVEEVEFEGRVRWRIVDYLRYSNTAEGRDYSDNEHVYMMRELIQDGEL